jgi:hypothetical protein
VNDVTHFWDEQWSDVDWGLSASRPLQTAFAAAFALAAVLVEIWAVWHGGVPQFSEVGWI